MTSMLKVSEAASLALHTAVFLADNPDQAIPARNIADVLHVSEAHLSKVLQRLGHAGLVRSTRGPHGGFVLSRPGDRITLLEVYEAIEGPIEDCDCLFTTAVCGRANCILGGLLQSVNQEVRRYFSGRKLTDLTAAYQALHGR